jgi:hypothetical protein
MKIKIAAGFILVGIIFIITTIFRFTHPALTETQLFLAVWPIWVLFFVVLGAITYFLAKAK